MYCTLDDLTPLKQQQKRLIGLDIGDRRIGVSACDATWFIASPLAMLDRKTDWKAQLHKLLKQYPVGAFVSGLPLLMNGDEGPQAKKVKEFLEAHFASLGFPIYLWDERLSTCAANRTLIEADMSRAKRKETVDKVAASFILQGVLDRLRTSCL
ncbi:MAG: Holliday junction resolvase RuvX [Candidatus Paracaedibacteraceae bacterium]|nr:Holliday junction resolvase RuvX [Candidatus Paracaedibacteraceae bacterium]